MVHSLQDEALCARVLQLAALDQHVLAQSLDGVHAAPVHASALLGQEDLAKGATPHQLEQLKVSNGDLGVLEPSGDLHASHARQVLTPCCSSSARWARGRAAALLLLLLLLLLSTAGACSCLLALRVTHAGKGQVLLVKSLGQGRNKSQHRKAGKCPAAGAFKFLSLSPLSESVSSTYSSSRLTAH